jgi:hypothetical protein
MYADSETRMCPQCDLPVVPFTELEESHDAKLLASEDALDPLDEPLDSGWWGRGRGVVIVLCVAGMAAFFSPWLHQTAPEVQTWSGFEFSRRLGWLWGAGIAWPVMLTLVLTRRTIRQMRGARLALAMLSGIVVFTVATRMLLPAPESDFVPRRFGWGWGMYWAGALGVLGLVASWRFGGSGVDVATTHPLRRDDDTLH